MRFDGRMIFGAMATLLALAGCDKAADKASAPSGPIAAVAPPSGTSWTETVTLTPSGGYLMGNPNASVKLVEYASLTCPHCRDFSKEAAAPLRDTYVASGRVSWEFRSFALNPIDVSATLLATCQGPAPFFKLIEQSYQEQEKWIQPFQKLSPAQQQALGAMPQEKQFQGLAKAGALDTFYRVRGLPGAKADACLTDKAAIDRIVAIRERGIKDDNVEGTPTFLINGVKVEVPPSWKDLEPELKKALG